mmetsp:Transcript_53449/g.125710  ORF Transcript_53449/g.125710 Transcript_53449/m.125710 type:complete len:254 (-) Transcript_53449:1662-2423(-)
MTRAWTKNTVLVCPMRHDGRCNPQASLIYNEISTLSGTGSIETTPLLAIVETQDVGILVIWVRRHIKPPIHKLLHLRRSSCRRSWSDRPRRRVGRLPQHHRRRRPTTPGARSAALRPCRRRLQWPRPCPRPSTRHSMVGVPVLHRHCLRGCPQHTPTRRWPHLPRPRHGPCFPCTRHGPHRPTLAGWTSRRTPRCAAACWRTGCVIAPPHPWPFHPSLGRRRAHLLPSRRPRPVLGFGRDPITGDHRRDLGSR